MKRIYILSTITIFAISISACSAPATPTIAAVDVQNTVFVAALTIVAQTHAALPTLTPIPATQTPMPTVAATETPTILPSLEATASATLTATAGADPCNAPLMSAPMGQPTKIKLQNQTGAPITVSVYLNLTPFGQCGFRGYNLRKNDALTITDLPQACYNISVFVNDPDKPTKSFGYGCINNPDQWTFVITRDNVTLQGR